MLKNIKNIKSNVLKILETNPSARDSDMSLFLIYIDRYLSVREKIGFFNFATLCHILLSKDCPKFESVRRNRQLIQEEGLFLGTKRETRKLESEKVKKFLRKGQL